MRPCYAVELVTPKEYLLRGLWFGPKRAKRVIVFVHGLSGSAFSMKNVLELLVDKKTAVLTFNNRGFEIVSTLRTKRKEKESERLKGGAAHEVFTECVDDITGAIRFAKSKRAKEIFLAGHSTGCQKSIYWASRTKARGVKGIILLAPVSDWAGEMKRQGAAKVARAMTVARTLLRRGKKHELLPSGLWHETLDAQRFLSLYDPDSVEEIFSYGQPQKNPRALKSVRVPILVLWAARDQFSDRPAERVREWFEKHMQSGEAAIIPRVRHGFLGAERKVVQTIRQWMKKR